MRRDRLIKLQTIDGETTNAFNEKLPNWADLCEEWASRKDASDSQKVAAGMEFSTLLSRFIVRSNKKTRTLTTKDRIQGEGGNWDIVGIKEMDRNQNLEITARRRSD